MLRTSTPLFALCIGVSRMVGQSPVTSGVDQLIQQALGQNHEILAAQQRVAEARGVLRQAGVRPAGTVESNVASGRPLATQGEEEFAVGYSQPIETGGKRPKRLLVAEKNLEVAEAGLAERKRQLAYDIKARYIDLVASRRKVEAIDRILAVNRESYRLVDARVLHGDAAPLERQLLLVEMNRAEAQRATTAGQALSAQIELRRAVAAINWQPPEPAAAVAPAAISSPLEEIRVRALAMRPDLRVLRALSAQSAAEFELVEASGHPDLTVSAQYSRRHAQFEDPLRTTGSGSPLLLQDRDNILTLGISIPVQTKKRNQGNLEAAVARQHAAELQREHLEVTIPIEVDAAWQRYQAARNTVSMLNRGVLDESEKNLAVIRQAYNLGQLRLLDVLNEQRRLLETQLSYVDAEADVARSLAELERAAGGSVQ